MNRITTPAVAGRELFSSTSPFNGLAVDGSPKFTAHTLARVAASSLVMASAGFGCLFAWRSNEPHGDALAALAVLFAAALELAKPLAVAACLSGFTSLRVAPRALAMALLAVAAIVYSLTAELALWSGARGDNAARREAQIARNTADRSAIADAQRELASLPVARSAEELQPLIDALLATKHLNGCQTPWPSNPTLREKCEAVAALRSELGRAERRRTLQAQITDAGHSSETNVVRAADPAATAVATYLAAIGVTVPPDALTNWLALVPVLSLEIGSALAGLLVAAFAPVAPRFPAERRVTVQRGDHARAVPRVAEQTVSTDQLPVATDQVIGQTNPPDRAVYDQLKHVASDGMIKKSQRGLARLIGVPQSTLNAQLHALVAVGLISMITSNAGTTITLHG